jgi:hypothetical protein
VQAVLFTIHLYNFFSPFSILIQCQQPFSEEDVVVLNGNPEDLDLMRTKLEARQARYKAEKKARNNTKRKGQADATATSTETSNDSHGDAKNMSELSSEIHDHKEGTKASAAGEDGRRKSELQNGKSDANLMLKIGSKLSGMLMEYN